MISFSTISFLICSPLSNFLLINIVTVFGCEVICELPPNIVAQSFSTIEKPINSHSKSDVKSFVKSLQKTCVKLNDLLSECKVINPHSKTSCNE